MPIDQKTKDRIKQDAKKIFDHPPLQSAYATGAEAEAEKVAGLLQLFADIDSFVDDILYADPLNLAAKQIKKQMKQALVKYNNDK